MRKSTFVPLHLTISSTHLLRPRRILVSHLTPLVSLHLLHTPLARSHSFLHLHLSSSLLHGEQWRAMDSKHLRIASFSSTKKTRACPLRRQALTAGISCKRSTQQRLAPSPLSVASFLPEEKSYSGNKGINRLMRLPLFLLLQIYVLHLDGWFLYQPCQAR